MQCRWLPDRAGTAIGCHHDWQADHQQCSGDPRAQDEGLVAEKAGAAVQEAQDSVGGGLPAHQQRGSFPGVPGDG